MENAEEQLRLELKTDPEQVRREALWCGVGKGMKLLDAGCGPGIVTAVLASLTESTVVGVDYSPKTIAYARDNYTRDGQIKYVLHDLRDELPFSTHFDIIWSRFVLEYNKTSVADIVRNLSNVLKPGGLLCLLDLDNNCLVHYPLPPRLEKALSKVMHLLETRYDFDPYVGRKLYSLMYDAGFQDIQVDMKPHHLIYGDVSNVDLFNWTKKVEMVVEKAPVVIEEDYPDGTAFLEEFERFFRDPKRFTYTPLIMCKGVKPATV